MRGISYRTMRRGGLRRHRYDRTSASRSASWHHIVGDQQIGAVIGLSFSDEGGKGHEIHTQNPHHLVLSRL